MPKPVESQQQRASERLISCERCCQRGPEWAARSSCRRVSCVRGPHCGPLSCSMGPLMAPPRPFIGRLSTERGARWGFASHNTWQFKSPLTELSPHGKRVRKRLSAGERLSSDSCLVNWVLPPDPEVEGMGAEGESAV
ncbi:hypothetical protein EYF80_054798 [Liparis tanakae]|uniref:Uncharacterized protein n=1 Tax=Liparis tanakae TaxID=230148 RepID=A0A4Z2F2Q5_9TELE|nr:hypothetical protein EYF80_054798 [Liparis tanakae]